MPDSTRVVPRYCSAKFGSIFLLADRVVAECISAGSQLMARPLSRTRPRCSSRRFAFA
jgi:hypothetical protein